MSALNEIAILFKAMGGDQVSSEAKKVTTATEVMAQGMNKIESAIKAAVVAFATYKLLDYAKDAAMAAARYETLGIVMSTVGNNAGYTGQQMLTFQSSLEKTGISMTESRQVLTQMASAHMDLAKSSELARIAQDAAVIGQMNSSEAFQQMVTGIQRGETEIMKTLGLNVDFNASQQRLAASLGKTTQELTATEKVQANMNATTLKGKDIAGVYESAMGTASKQISSMQRYMDNLKVTAGGVFNDILIVAVQAFTGGLKEANTEAEKLQREGQLKEWGKDIVLSAAAIADGLMIAYHALNTLVVTGVAGFSQLYYGAKALGQALLGDFSGAKESFDSLLSTGSAWSKMIGQQWSENTKFQDAANKMYVDRANQSAQLAQKERADALEKKQLASGLANQAETDAQQQDLFLKKHREEWGKIVVAQLESVGAYSQAAEKAIELNTATDAYKTLLNKSEEAQAALTAQRTLDGNKLLDAKRKELEFENSHLQVIQQLHGARMAALGVSGEEITLSLQSRDLALQEKSLQDQINTETNPTRKLQLQEQLQVQQSINFAVKDEGESRLKIIQNQQTLAALQQSLKMGTALGQDTNTLQTTQTLMAYETKRLELQEQLTAARAAENYPLVDITQQMQTQLDLLYSQSSANDTNMDKLRSVLGLEQGITTEKKKQADNKYRNTAGEEVVSSQNIVSGDEYLNQLVVNLKNTIQYAAAIEYSVSLQKQITAEQGRRQEIENNKYQKQIDDQRLADQQAAADREKAAQEAAIADAKARAEEQARVNAEIISNAQNAVSQTISAVKTMASQLKTMSESLRSAAINIRDVYNSNLTTTGGAVSPEQAYLSAKALFAQTAAQAQTTGNAELYNQLPTLANKLLAASSAYNSSGAAYQTDFSAVQAVLLESAGRADVQATAAEQTVILLNKQEELLIAIKTALQSGGDTASLINQVAIINGQVLSATNSVTTSVGGATSAINSGLGATGAINSGLGASGIIATRMGTTGSLSALMESVRATTANVNNSVGTVNSSVGLVGNNTSTASGMGAIINASLLNRQTGGKLAQTRDSYNLISKPQNSATNQWIADAGTTTFTYYAKGGVANQPSIFGEAGPEAAVPLPDGRSIPVTISGWAAADNRGLIVEIQALKSELVEVKRQIEAGNRIAIAVGEETIAIGTRQAKSSEVMALTARQAVNQ